MLTKMAHTSLKVRNLENSKRFYIDTLGLEHILDTASENYYFSLLRIGDSVLELLESRTELCESRTAGIIDHIAFWVDDLGKTIRELESKKIIKLMEIPKLIMESEIIFIEGPDGERIELMQAINIPELEQ